MPITTLSPGKLAAIQSGYVVDGRISWFPDSSRGYSTVNCYLLTEEDGSLLVDTGLPIHRDQIVADACAARTPGQAFDILLLRMTEFDSTSNLVALEEAIGIGHLYSTFDDGPLFGALSTDDDEQNARHRERLEKIQVAMLRGRSEIQVGAAGTRAVKVIRPLLRLLPTYWIYDAATKTLITSDMFGWNLGASPADAFVLDSAKDAITAAQVRNHLLKTRYWWLPDADIPALRKDIEAVFTENYIERIAPARGAIICGRAAVDRHVGLLDEVLAQLGAEQFCRTATGAT